MICRVVFWPEFMHIAARTSHKGVPTAHCTHSRSDASCNFMKYKDKVTCLFFDQVNNYSNFRCFNQVTWLPSTDLSTVIVDKLAVDAAKGSIPEALRQNPSADNIVGPI